MVWGITRTPVDFGAGASPLLTNLASYWKLDEESGTRNDSHGTNHLTDNNTVLFGAGKIGNAAAFVAANSESLSRADNASLSTGDIDFTIAGWVYLDVLTATGDGLFHKGVNGSNNYEFQVIWRGTQSRFAVFMLGSAEGGGNATNFGLPLVETWYWVCAWHDSVNNLIGIQINDSTPNTFAHANGVLDTTGPFSLGAINGIQPLGGRIDEVGFWKRVLTADERAQIYNAGNGVTYPGFL